MLSLVSLFACDDQHSNRIDTNNENVLVKVNGETITESDVDFLLRAEFSQASQIDNDAKVRDKVLKSLIASSAMRQLMEQTLATNQLERIEQKVAFHREELLVKEFLLEHAVPAPISSEMVQNYYYSHQDEFGGGKAKIFELLKAGEKLSEGQRDELLNNRVQIIKAAKNWRDEVNSNAVFSGLLYQQGTMRPGLLNATLENTLKNLDKGRTSDVVFIKGRPNILRVIDVKTLTPAPLAEVSHTIRKKLTAMQLKKAVKKASEKAVKETNIEFAVSDKTK
ncbi:peptidylprolyl isomerase [Eionea flava]